MEFGQLQTVEIRKVWPHEALSFTPWLQENIHHLGRALGLELEVVAREAPVGGFSLDLLAKDLGTGKPVIIENQFGTTDHDHFGKLLTYAAGFDASTIIWIAESIRDEHRSALEWLNQRTEQGTQFFAVTVEVFRIDDSRPVYRFQPVVLPNEWQKDKKVTPSTTVSPKLEAYRVFFQHLIDTLRDTHRFTGARVGQAQSWYNFSSGFSGVVYSVSFTQNNQVRAELYIDVGDAAKNKHLFDWLQQQQPTIQPQFTATLQWERLDTRRASRIALYRDGAIFNDVSTLEAIEQWCIDSLLQLRKVFDPYLKQYKQQQSSGASARS
jgi:hypothetical protein